MTENRRQVLDMLAQGKITVEEAERLLSLVDQPAGAEARSSATSEAGKPAPKYLLAHSSNVRSEFSKVTRTIS